MTVDPRYLEDASGFRGQAQRIFRPESGEEAARILAEASAQEEPVTVYGAGTGLTGGAVAQGGWVISTERLNRLEVERGRAEAGAGVRLQDLHAAAARSGQFYPPDPTEWSASVGGTIATNASGSRSFLYGPTRRYIRSLEVALMDGRVLRFGRGEAIDFRVPRMPALDVTKNTAGFHLRPGMDWVDLFAGSEGTLGLVTAARLDLLPEPCSLIAGVVFLPGDDAVLRAVDAWRTVNGVRMIEYFDGRSLDLLRARYPDVPTGAGGALLFEQETGGGDEDQAELDRWLDRLDLAGADIERSWFASSDADRERFRRFRHALPEMVNDMVRRRGLMKMGSDYAVPIARNGEMLALYRDRLAAEFPDRYCIFGHIGDAHVHVNLLPEGPAEFDRGRELLLEFARQAVAMGGTVSAEHGLGKRKAELLRIQYSGAEIESMRAVKLRLDPKWLLGRGNLFAFRGAPSI